MYCKKCNIKTKVTESATEADCVYRERTCPNCGQTYYTIEREGDWNKILPKIRYIRSRQVNKNRN